MYDDSVCGWGFVVGVVVVGVVAVFGYSAIGSPNGCILIVHMGMIHIFSSIAAQITHPNERKGHTPEIARTSVNIKWKTYIA